MKAKAKCLLPKILPYLLVFWLLDWLSFYYHLVPGNALVKIIALIASPPSLTGGPLFSPAPADLLSALIGSAVLWAFLTAKHIDRKKFRKGEEFGSGRWGTRKDIAPFIDPVLSHNILFTQTERLTMNNRPANPDYARNKNVLVVGGSGSGKTRFHVKPNIMQMYGSYVVTDPKGDLIVDCGKMLQNHHYRIKVFNTVNFEKSMHYNREATRCSQINFAWE